MLSQVEQQVLSLIDDDQLIHWVQAYLAEHGVDSRLVPNADGSKANLYATVGPAVTYTVTRGMVTQFPGTSPWLDMADPQATGYPAAPGDTVHDPDLSPDPSWTEEPPRDQRSRSFVSKDPGRMVS